MAQVSLLALASAWCGLSALSLMISFAWVNSLVHCFAALGFAQSYVLWTEADRLHAYSFSPLHIFIATSAGYFVGMPWLSVVLDYHFLISPEDRLGVIRLLQIQFWITLLFFFGYRAAVGSSQLRHLTLDNQAVAHRHISLIITASFLGILVGITSYGWLYQNLWDAFGEGYAQLGIALRGSGWIMRLAELLAVGGLVLFALGRLLDKMTITLAGLSFLAVYSVLRVPFENRENVIRFLLVGLIYLCISSNVRISRKTIGLLFASIVALAAGLPVLSYLRGGQDLGAVADLYTYFLFRDLNFSETISALLASGDRAGTIGWAEGAKSIIGALIPRDLWPEKPFPIAVQITSWVTPVLIYDADDPSFAYATGFLGAAYAVQGITLSFILSALLGLFAGLAIKWARRPPDHWIAHLKLLVVAVYTYFGCFSIHKLDPANVIPAALFPLTFLTILYLAAKSQLVTHTGSGASGSTVA